jgi:peptidoglycan/LPS O-acetylase OafA/YrhL
LCHVHDVPPRLRHQPALDGLRGAAVAGVLLFHGGHLAGGFLGVDAFFVLSGFLITSLLLAETQSSGRIALGAFWARRARRLLPALALVLLAVALYSWFLARPEELATIRGDALSTVGYVANWRAIASSRDYWALFRAPSPLDHTWSLAIEEQFYLVWPVVVALVTWRAESAVAARRVLVLSGALALTSLVWMVWIFSPPNPSRVYFGTDTRAASILVGAALAAALTLRGSARSRSSRVTLEILALVSLGVLAFAWVRASGSSDVLYRGGLFACAVATAVVIAAAVNPRRGPVAKLLSWRPLCLLGLISYGVYLWHWPVYVVLDPVRMHFGGWPLLGVRVAVTLVVSVASYRFVEQPIRRGRVRSLNGKRVVAVLVPATVIIVVMAVLFTTAGAPAPRVVVADQIRPAPRVVASSAALRARLPIRVLVVGNSIALYTADEGFKRLRTSPALDVLNLGSIGCRLLPQETRSRYPSGDVYASQTEPCEKNWALAVSLFRPDVVVVLVSDPTDAEHEIDGHWTAPCDALYDATLTSDLNDQIRLLSSRGARVVVATSAYAGFPGKSRTWYAHDDCQNNTFREVVRTEPHTVLADLSAWMCPVRDADCHRTVDGVVLRPDGVHFRDASARIFAAWLIAQAQRRGVLAGLRVDRADAFAAADPPVG